ncbi:MAG: DUF6340 family protein [Desulfobacter sp.]
MKSLSVMSIILGFVCLLSGCISSSAPPGVIVTSVMPGKIDLDQVPDIYEGIVINEVQDPSHTKRGNLIKAHLESALREIPSFNIVESSSNINKPVIYTIIERFEVQPDEVRQGYIKRRGIVRVQFILSDSSRNVVGSSSEFAEIDNIKRVGTKLKSSEEIEERLAKNVCQKFAQKLVPTKTKEYRVFIKGNSTVNKGIKAASINNWEYATTLWESELKKNPENHAAAYNLGIGYEKEGQWNDALKMYETAKKLKPFNKEYCSAAKKMKAKFEAKENVEKIQEAARPVSSTD